MDNYSIISKCHSETEIRHNQERLLWPHSGPCRLGGPRALHTATAVQLLTGVSFRRLNKFVVGREGASRVRRTETSLSMGMGTSGSMRSLRLMNTNG